MQIEKVFLTNSFFRIKDKSGRVDIVSEIGPQHAATLSYVGDYGGCVRVELDGEASRYIPLSQVREIVEAKPVSVEAKPVPVAAIPEIPPPPDTVPALRKAQKR